MDPLSQHEGQWGGTTRRTLWVTGNSPFQGWWCESVLPLHGWQARVHWAQPWALAAAGVVRRQLPTPKQPGSSEQVVHGRERSTHCSEAAACDCRSSMAAELAGGHSWALRGHACCCPGGRGRSTCLLLFHGQAQWLPPTAHPETQFPFSDSPPCTEIPAEPLILCRDCRGQSDCAQVRWIVLPPTDQLSLALAVPPQRDCSRVTGRWQAGLHSLTASQTKSWSRAGTEARPTGLLSSFFCCQRRRVVKGDRAHCFHRTEGKKIHGWVWIPFASVYFPFYSFHHLGLKVLSKNKLKENSPSNVGGAGLIPGQETNIPHVSWPKNQNIKQK